MGQEFLEDKYWSDNPAYFDSTLIWWDGLSDDRAMQDFHRFMRELVGVRRRFRALRSDSIDVFHVHNDNRVITFHRWIEGVGEDVVVVVSLSEHTWYSYELGFPANGSWREVFNSDVYDNWVNPITVGNGGGIVASRSPLHGMPCSANIVIPANAILVFAR